MAKKGGDVGGDVTLGTDAWNVADRFTRTQVMDVLEEIKELLKISQFGTSYIDEDTLYTPYQIKKRRMESLERTIFTIGILIEGTEFAIKKQDKPTYERWEEKLDFYSSLIPKLYRQEEGDNLNDDLFEIDEIKFIKILKSLRKIRKEIFYPLNRAGLIFRQSEEVDLDKIKKGIIEGG